MSKLSDRQLTLKSQATLRLEDQVTQVMHDIVEVKKQIDVKLKIDARLPSKPYTDWTIPQLQDAINAYSKVLMKLKSVEVEFASQVKEIDKVIMQKRQ